MTDKKGIPLSLGEARGVAEQIRAAARAGGPVDPSYWPWVIEQLCNRAEADESVLRRLTEISLDYDVHENEHSFAEAAYRVIDKDARYLLEGKS